MINILRTFLWKQRMRKVRRGMSPHDVESRLGKPSGRYQANEIEIWYFNLGKIDGMMHSIRVAFADDRVNQVYLGIEASEDAKPADKSPGQIASEPFMEHPSGEFKNATEAMTEAIRRLRALPSWEKFITFCAQGENPFRPGTIKFAEVRLLGNKLEVDEQPLDCDLVCKTAGLAKSVMAASGGQYLISLDSPNDLACLLDAIFREHFQIRPFADEKNDYAVGAEW